MVTYVRLPPESHSSHSGRFGSPSEVRYRVLKSGCSFVSLSLCVNEPKQVRNACRAPKPWGGDGGCRGSLTASDTSLGQGGGGGWWDDRGGEAGEGGGGEAFGPDAFFDAQVAQDFVEGRAVEAVLVHPR